MTGGSPTWDSVQWLPGDLSGEWRHLARLWKGGGRRLHGCAVTWLSGVRHLVVAGGQGSRGPPWHKGRYKGQGWQEIVSVSTSVEILNLENENAEWTTLPDSVLEHIWRPGVVSLGRSGGLLLVGGLNHAKFWRRGGRFREKYDGVTWKVVKPAKRRRITKSKSQVLCSYVWLSQKWCSKKNDTQRFHTPSKIHKVHTHKRLEMGNVKSRFLIP